MDRPYVVVNEHRDTGIMLVRGRKVVRVLGRDPYFRIQRVPLRDFDTEWKPLHYYQNGSPSEQPYDLQEAARKYLEYSRNAGITGSALRCLNEILEGRYTMLEEAATSSDESVVTPAPSKSSAVPKMDGLSDALKKAASGKTPKSSTHNGTSAAAKRPSKATTVQAKSANGSTSTEKEKDMQARTSKTAKTTKTNGAVVMKTKPGKEPKVASKKKAPAEKQPAAKKPKKAAAPERGRAPSVSDDAVLTYVAENPKRKGTDAFRKFAVYKKGMTIGEVVKKNVDRADVNYNLKRGFIKIKG